MNTNPTRKRYTALASSVIVVAMRWTDRLLGLISTLVLARLLLPADFGVIAMTSLVVGLIEIMMDLGVTAALIHDKSPTQADYDTAWTIRLLQSLLAGLVIAALAPLAATYFNDDRVENVLRVMAITTAITGLSNIGLVTFQKEMQFGYDFWFFFIRRLVAFLVTLTLAWWLRTYWAMVLGALAGRTTGVLLSYLMHEMRPRFSLRRFRKIWSFSQMMLLRSIGAYANLQVDKLILGARVPADILGGYRVADEVSSMPTTEMLAPLGRVLFPAFVESRDHPEQLRLQFLLAFGVQVTVAMPAAIGLILVADLAVPLLLGEKWAFTIPLVQWLALGQLAVSVTHAPGYLLMAAGRIGLLAGMTWLQVALFLLFAHTVFIQEAAPGIAILRFAVAALCTPIFFLMLFHALRKLTVRDIGSYLWRPTFASAVMAILLLMLDLSTLPTIASFGTKVATGATSYIVTVMTLWYLAGKPVGVESWIIGKLNLERRLRWPSTPPSSKNGR